MSIEDKIKNAKPCYLFDNLSKKEQRRIITKNKRQLKRIKRRRLRKGDSDDQEN